MILLIMNRENVVLMDVGQDVAKFLQTADRVSSAPTAECMREASNASSHTWLNIFPHRRIIATHGRETLGDFADALLSLRFAVRDHLTKNRKHMNDPDVEAFEGSLERLRDHWRLVIALLVSVTTAEQRVLANTAQLREERGI